MKPLSLILRALTASSVLGLGSLSFANSVGETGSFSWNRGPFQSGQGGEFSLYNFSSDGVDHSHYSSLTQNQYQTGIQTFCLERTEWAGSSFYVLSSAASLGSAGGFDPISQGTVWLYSQFAAGTLSEYFANSSDRRTQAGLLQNAIWALEDEPNTPDVSNNPYYHAALANGGTANAALPSDVMVMVNFDSAAARDAYVAWLGDQSNTTLYNQWYSHRRQDFLFWDGNGALVPDGGTTVILLGLGLIGLAAGRRLMATKAA